ncbi:acetyl-CoA carboxylase biotin carboxylase subunit family protein [Catellatospora bangladeshensis]|uniref:ATP-grasp domain-containing protein n=1 Tax=Catellatospora bangladeshensis TaxID=310355 RepID=UPI003609CE95
MARHLLLVGSSSAALRAAAELGFRVTHLDDIRRVRPEHLGRAARTVLTDLSDEAEVLAMAAAVHRADPVEMVLSMQEDSLEVAALLAARLGVPGLAADAVANTRDKARMRAVTQAAGLASTVPFLAGPSTPGDRLRWAGEVGYPVISKPRDGSGSRDIRIHRRAEDLATAAPTALLEKYVGGSEHSIEAVSRDGVHHLVAVTDKTVSADGRFVEMGHCQPSRLPADVLGRARDELAAFLDAVGVVNGVTHTEIKVCDGRVFIVESHTRPGGDRIVEITKAATGLDLAVAGLAAVAGLPSAGVAAGRPAAPSCPATSRWPRPRSRPCTGWTRCGPTRRC